MEKFTTVIEQQPLLNTINAIDQGLDNQSFFYALEQVTMRTPPPAAEFIMRRMMRME